jgi:hypothetical protein
MNMVECHRLAQFIEATHAKEKAIVKGRVRLRWEDLYDPLAATCLGDLIYDLVHPRSQS